VGWVKLSVDGSYSDREGSGGAGLVVRNTDGSVLLAACVHIPNCIEAEEVEARAALLGLKHSGNIHFNKLILETDCNAVASALQSKDQDRSKWCAIYEEAKSVIRNLAVCRVELISRNVNGVADALARIGRCGEDKFFADDFLDHVSELVKNDCNSLCLSDI
jgi:ribonuclease HI